MKVTRSGKEFTLRCDMRALANAKRESGIDIGQLEEDAIQIGTLVYYLAQSGAKFAGVPFDYDLDDFLGLIDMADMDAMTTALVALLGGGGNQKKAKASRGRLITVCREGGGNYASAHLCFRTGRSRRLCRWRKA